MNQNLYWVTLNIKLQVYWRNLKKQNAISYTIEKQ